MTKTGLVNGGGILNFGHWCLFVICNLIVELFPFTLVATTSFLDYAGFMKRRFCGIVSDLLMQALSALTILERVLRGSITSWTV